MLDTNSFGQSASSPFVSPSTGGSTLGVTSTGMFGTTSSSASASSLNATLTPAFSASSNPGGIQITLQASESTGISQSDFGSQCEGSRIATYTTTDENSTQPAGKLQSISAMPFYESKSHEELRSTDYELENKGGCSPAFSTLGFSFHYIQTFTPPPLKTSPSGVLSTLPTYGSTGFGQSAFGVQCEGSRVATYTATAEVDGLSGRQCDGKLQSISAMPVHQDKSHEKLRWDDHQLGNKGGHPSVNPWASSATSNQFLPKATTSSSFVSSPSIFISTSGLTSGLSLFSTQSSQVFHATSSLQQTNSSCGQSSSSFGPGNALSLNQPNMFSVLSTGSGGNVFSSTTSLLYTTNPSGSIQTTLSSTLQPSQTTQTADAFLSGCGRFKFQWSPADSPVIGLPLPVTSSFGIPHAVPQMSNGFPGSTPSIQYGISSIPVTDWSAPTRSSSLLTGKHLSRRQITVVRKHHPKSDGPKIPFYTVDEGKANMPKANAIFIPRENPRAWVISPTEKCPQRASPEKTTPLVHASSNVYENFTGHRAGEAATTHEHGVDVKALMPKLQSHEYYREPQIQELAPKERTKPGFCSCVNDFVVGQHGYGSMKFNNREVTVYTDESKKPPVGQGLNKPAVRTVLNIKCIGKKTGKRYTGGPKVDKYREMLIKAAADQGAKFVS